MGLTQFWVNACVKLHHSLKVLEKNNEDTGTLAQGYYITIGVTSESEKKAQEMIMQLIQDGELVWSDSDIERKAIDDLGIKPEELSADPYLSGVWYVSGKVFFVEDDIRKNGFVM